jgi:hypothetical protein
MGSGLELVDAGLRAAKRKADEFPVTTGKSLKWQVKPR